MCVSSVSKAIRAIIWLMSVAMYAVVSGMLSVLVVAVVFALGTSNPVMMVIPPDRIRAPPRIIPWQVPELIWPLANAYVICVRLTMQLFMFAVNVVLLFLQFVCRMIIWETPHLEPDPTWDVALALDVHAGTVSLMGLRETRAISRNATLREEAATPFGPGMEVFFTMAEQPDGHFILKEVVLYMAGMNGMHSNGLWPVYIHDQVSVKYITRH